MKKLAALLSTVAAIALLDGTFPAFGTEPDHQPVSVAATQVVQGAHVNIVAQWNESKSATGVYQAPAGFTIKSAVPVVRSALRADSNVAISADRNSATLAVHVRGKGEWWNKERGWFDGYLNIELVAIH